MMSVLEPLEVAASVVQGDSIVALMKDEAHRYREWKSCNSERTFLGGLYSLWSPDLAFF
jgi:hypothetical protein